MEWESKTVAACINGQNFTIADFRQITDRLFDKADWKKPWSAAVHHSLVPAVLKAVEWFHADRPVIEGIEQLTGNVILSGRGYQA